MKTAQSFTLPDFFMLPLFLFFFFFSSGIWAEEKNPVADGVVEDALVVLNEFQQPESERSAGLSETGKKALGRIAGFVGEMRGSPGKAFTELNRAVQNGSKNEEDRLIFFQLAEEISRIALDQVIEKNVPGAVNTLLGLFTLGGDLERTGSFTDCHVGFRIQSECSLAPIIKIMKQFPGADFIPATKEFFRRQGECIDKKLIINAARESFEKSIKNFLVDPKEIGENFEISINSATGKYLFKLRNEGLSFSDEERKMWGRFIRSKDCSQLLNNARTEYKRSLMYCRTSPPYPMAYQVRTCSQVNASNPFFVCLPDFTRLFVWEMKLFNLKKIVENLN